MIGDVNLGMGRLITGTGEVATTGVGGEVTVSWLTCDVAETAEGKRPGIDGLCSCAVYDRSMSPLGDLGDLGKVGVLEAMKSLKLSERINGLGLEGKLPDLILLRIR